MYVCVNRYCIICSSSCICISCTYWCISLTFCETFTGRTVQSRRADNLSIHWEINNIWQGELREGFCLLMTFIFLTLLEYCVAGVAYYCVGFIYPGTTALVCCVGSYCMIQYDITYGLSLLLCGHFSFSGDCLSVAADKGHVYMSDYSKAPMVTQVRICSELEYCFDLEWELLWFNKSSV